MSDNYQYNIHESFMARAIELSKKGTGHVSPNPLVGCILVKEGEIIGEGFHAKYGDSHAEVMAYNNSIKDPTDSTMYVTLEPCCFRGKTPACTQFIIENSIREVYISMKDPNPKVSGRGIRELEKYGIKVHIGLLQEESEWLNRGYIKLITTNKPWIIAKAAQSENNFLGSDSKSTTNITGKEARYHSHALRSCVDAIMIGRQTALVDNPQLTVRHVNGVNPIRVVLDTNRKLPLTLNIFNDNKADTIILCSKINFDKSSTSFAKYVPIEEDESGKLCIDNILEILGKEGITKVLIEGGAELLNSLREKDLIDEIHLYTSSNKLYNATLKNPLAINDNWNIRKKVKLGDDSLVIATRKEKCLQES